jgi:hypothetical protein
MNAPSCGSQPTLAVTASTTRLLSAAGHPVPGLTRSVTSPSPERTHRHDLPTLTERPDFGVAHITVSCCLGPAWTRSALSSPVLVPKSLIRSCASNASGVNAVCGSSPGRPTAGRLSSTASKSGRAIHTSFGAASEDTTSSANPRAQAARTTTAVRVRLSDAGSGRSACGALPRSTVRVESDEQSRAPGANDLFGNV